VSEQISVDYRHAPPNAAPGGSFQTLERLPHSPTVRSVHAWEVIVIRGLSRRATPPRKIDIKLQLITGQEGGIKS
jgi:hypothetical protein